jgi:hypothetical protein
LFVGTLHSEVLVGSKTPSDAINLTLVNTQGFCVLRLFSPGNFLMGMTIGSD